MPAAYLRGPAVDAPPTDYRAGCSGKLKLSRSQARIVATRRHGWTYECPECGAWHTSTTRETPRPANTLRAFVRSDHQRGSPSP